MHCGPWRSRHDRRRELPAESARQFRRHHQYSAYLHHQPANHTLTYIYIRTSRQTSRSLRLGQMLSAPQHFAWFHWIGHPRKPPGRCKHLGSICHTSRVIGDFLPKFRCHGNKGRPHNILHVSIESAIPDNPLVGPTISSLSVIQVDL